MERANAKDADDARRVVARAVAKADKDVGNVPQFEEANVVTYLSPNLNSVNRGKPQRKSRGKPQGSPTIFAIRAIAALFTPPPPSPRPSSLIRCPGCRPEAPAPHGFDDHPSPDDDADGAVAVDETLAGVVWRQQNPETGFFPAAVIEGVRELAAADDAMAVEAAKVAAKARPAAQKAKDKAANAAVKREAKGAKAAARAAAKAERRAAKKREQETTLELSKE
jgi:hypothetical protein